MFHHVETIMKSKRYNYKVYLVYDKPPYYEICNYKGNKIIDKVSYRYIYANKIDLKDYIRELREEK